ncbi:MBL fold metallo-hydrolase [Simiduia aestuariiviva]|uniref:Glyoxylase-like metal-dependent hydrolase (Beta-lactamase superfamily II) n=1 Tax=Simiduia aestuariiviva TaxID=1510459 RepID=A0A839UM53_9GAMM|nr:MBL fold metallo-hydrolase [Simiduia aestuariiviva]MBB3168932.1 glyoxylase-like metal-dependent hydrolase (beta-lactamase superfamily II) [Simiduia aestuariiviva]
MAALPQQLIEFPLSHDTAVSVAPGVRRLVCNNPGMMTGPGTNTYIVGERRLAVIDPGPLDEHHLARLCALGDIGWVLVTHTHRDHSPAARVLAARTGARLLGAIGPQDGHQDDSMCPDVALTDGHQLATDEFTLTAIHTPGHVGNHFCFLHENSRVLFTGDHVMQGSTVVIIPPSGDMQAYIRSVEQLARLPLQALAPGHGHLLGDVPAYLSELVKHRLGREEKVWQALLRQREPQTMAALTALAYDDVDASLHTWAIYSLWAHLVKLEKEGRAQQCLPRPESLSSWQWIACK